MPAPQPTISPFATLHSCTDPNASDALAQVRHELLAVPAATVVRPNADGSRLGERVLVALADPRALDAEKEVHRRRLELLARALIGARHDFVVALNKPERPTRYDALVAEAAVVFRQVHEAARLLVRRQVIARSDFPRRVAGRTLDERCRYVWELVDLLVDHERELGDLPVDLLRRANSLATRLHGARPAPPGFVAARRLRDRAYTALRTALATTLGSRSRREPSGALVIDDEAALIRSVRCA
jgi:hypothetical protein